MNICQQIYFENLTQNCHKKVTFLKKLLKFTKIMLAKKANILKVVDLILFLYRGIWSSLFLKLPAFLKFCSSPSNTICKFPHLFSQVPYGGCSPHVLNTCRRPYIKVMLMPLWHYDYTFLILMIKPKREVLACELSFTGHSSPYSSHLHVTSFDFFFAFPFSCFIVK